MRDDHDHDHNHNHNYDDYDPNSEAASGFFVGFLILALFAVFVIFIFAVSASPAEAAVGRGAADHHRLSTLAYFFSSFFSEPARSRPISIIVEKPGIVPRDLWAFITTRPDAEEEGCIIHIKPGLTPDMQALVMAHEVCHCAIDYPWMGPLGWAPGVSWQAQKSMEQEAERCADRLVERLGATESRRIREVQAQRTRDNFAEACRERAALERWTAAETQDFEDWARREALRVLDAMAARDPQAAGLDMRSFVMGLRLPAAAAAEGVR